MKSPFDAVTGFVYRKIAGPFVTMLTTRSSARRRPGVRSFYAAVRADDGYYERVPRSYAIRARSAGANAGSAKASWSIRLR